MNDIPTNGEVIGWIVMLVVGLVVFGIILAAGKSAKKDYIDIDEWR